MSITASKLYLSVYGMELKKKISQPGEKNSQYKYYWKVKNVITGNIEIIKNKTEWCKKNDISLGMAKYHSKTEKEYKGFIIKRFLDENNKQNK